MAWNEPGGGGRDPWGGNNQQGPPDLEQAIKNLQGKLSGIFGGRGGGGGGSTGGGGGGRNFSALGVMVIAGVLLAGWLVAGFYIVDPAEEAVVTRFGKYVRTETSGPHWLPYFIEKHETVNVAQVRGAEIGFRTAGRGQGSVGNESLMLTQDENIVDIKFAVQYRVKNARNYLFKVRDPDLTLRQITESAVREVVGKSTMDFVLTGGRSAVADDTRVLVQDTLDKYGAGLFVISVNMQDAQPPAQVQDAFNDAVKAREDEQRLKNEAQAFANDILPKARGEGDAVRERAQGYKQRVTAQAEGQSDRFLALLTEYQKAPDVTRERIYLETMESVLGKSSKVLLGGGESSNNLMYLPLDKLMSRGFEDDEDGKGRDGSGESSPMPASRLRNNSDRFRSGRTR